VKNDGSRSISCIIPAPSGCGDSLFTSLSALVRSEARSEAEAATKDPITFGDQSKCKFSFQSVLAKTLEQLDMLQGISSTNISKRLPFYLMVFRESWAREPTHKVTPELDLAIVQILRLLVPLIIPLIDWQQPFPYGFILFILGRHREDAINVIAVVGASENRPIRLPV
jgi:hypothetical protein